MGVVAGWARGLAAAAADARGTIAASDAGFDAGLKEVALGVGGTRALATPFTTPSKTSKAKGTLLGTLQSAEDSTGRVALHAQPEGKGEEEADEQPALATTPASAPPKAMSIYERMQRAAAAPALAPPAPTPPLADEQEI
jgi:hypothetical protein